MQSFEFFFHLFWFFVQPFPFIETNPSFSSINCRRCNVLPAHTSAPLPPVFNQLYCLCLHLRESIQVNCDNLLKTWFFVICFFISSPHFIRHSLIWLISFLFFHCLTNFTEICATFFFTLLFLKSFLCKLLCWFAFFHDPRLTIYVVIRFFIIKIDRNIIF